MAQLVDEELADTGFTASYDTVDWLVPPGAWFYDALPALDAISRLAEASGAVVQSDPAEPNPPGACAVSGQSLGLARSHPGARAAGGHHHE